MLNLNRQASARNRNAAQAHAFGDSAGRFVTFRVNGQLYALPLDAVDRAVRMVSIAPMPSALSGVLGIVNVEGQQVPALDIRDLFGLPPKTASANDRLLLVTVNGSTMAIVADEVCTVLSLPPQIKTGLPFPEPAYVAGSVHQNGEVIFVLEPAELKAPQQPLMLPC
ncbi:MAG: chemotaxis protein CheW [Chloroflexi bacterium]|nr:chemotaxis protein CheW [Chloroflexota bacterium]MCL5273398.1 chemotaxis protein CheW [Chloroflexota bacterium]